MHNIITDNEPERNNDELCQCVDATKLHSSLHLAQGLCPAIHFIQNSFPTTWLVTAARECVCVRVSECCFVWLHLRCMHPYVIRSFSRLHAENSPSASSQKLWPSHGKNSTGSHQGGNVSQLGCVWGTGEDEKNHRTQCMYVYIVWRKGTKKNEGKKRKTENHRRVTRG